jgi:hypothetical protein
MKLKKIQIKYVDRVSNQITYCEAMVEDKAENPRNNKTKIEQFREKIRKLCNYPETKTVYV